MNMQTRKKNWHCFIPVIDVLGAILAIVASAEALLTLSLLLCEYY